MQLGLHPFGQKLSTKSSYKRTRSRPTVTEAFAQSGEVFHAGVFHDYKGSRSSLSYQVFALSVWSVYNAMVRPLDYFYFAVLLSLPCFSPGYTTRVCREVWRLFDKGHSHIATIFVFWTSSPLFPLLTPIFHPSSHRFTSRCYACVIGLVQLLLSAAKSVS